MIGEIKPYEERKKELIAKGKEAGYITYEQLAAALKGLDLDSDSLDDLYNSLMEANVQVVTDEDLAGEGEDDATAGGESIDDLLKDRYIKENPNIDKYCIDNVTMFRGLFMNEYEVHSDCKE